MTVKEVMDGRSVPILWIIQGIVLPGIAVLWGQLQDFDRRATDDRLKIRQEIQAAKDNIDKELTYKLDRIDDKLYSIQLDQREIVSDLNKKYVVLIDRIMTIGKKIEQ